MTAYMTIRHSTISQSRAKAEIRQFIELRVKKAAQWPQHPRHRSRRYRNQPG